jgi:hypothetical protein
MQVKAFLAAAVLAAIAIGLLLPTPHSAPQAEPVSQIPTMEVGFS